ncbi:hypothetical protein K1719_031203 [Acacia pycnantha]|nr:hypothetical protein K1719_031203 [Acacia pycnantha]
MEGAPPPNAGDNVQLLFADFMGRRSALVKALTEDADEFYEQCDPLAGRDIYLFGQSNGQWSVEVPAEDLPEIWPMIIRQPTTGFNFFRDTMPKKQWLYFVSHKTDHWLRAVAVCLLISMPGRPYSDWNRLFYMILQLPPLCEAVRDYYI